MTSLEPVMLWGCFLTWTNSLPSNRWILGFDGEIEGLIFSETGQIIATKIPPVGHSKWWFRIRESDPQNGPKHSG